MTRLAFVGTYLTAVAAAVVLLDANSGHGEMALVIWAVASALLAALAIPFAVPFGYPDHYQFSEPLPIWWSAAFCALFSACLILLGALIKLIVEAHRHQRIS
jgi:hypothetical protein